MTRLDCIDSKVALYEVSPHPDDPSVTRYQLVGVTDAMVERSLAAVPPGAMLGCTCPEASCGPRPDHCRCDERAHAYAMKQRRAAIVAALGQEKPCR